MGTTVIADMANERLDAFLARTLSAHSRNFWQQCCQKGMVTAAGQGLKASYRLKKGEEVVVALPPAPDFSSRTLPVMYEDADVIVINKPAGMLTHAKGALSQEFTVADFVRRYTSDGPGTNRPGIVHRLDRGTSGVIIAAKNPAAKAWLQKQFSQRKVKKTYLALVEGLLREPSATIVLPIERNPRKPQTFKVSANGRPAETVYETLETFAHSTLLALRPLTGRTHQLRVHTASIGHPIVGDAVYGHADTWLGRPFLHAARLELTLPSKERRAFEAPLPADLQIYLDGVRADA